jgi:hypothetical protein
MIKYIYNKYLSDKFHQEYIYNFLLGSLPTLSFFLFFPFYSKFMSRDNLSFTLKIIPIFATILAVDLGANRFVLRAVNLKSSKKIIEKLLSNYFSYILINFTIIIIPAIVFLKYFNIKIQTTSLTNAYLIILFFSPILIISNIYYIYFDTNKKFNFNNLIISPISSLTWILLFLISFVNYDNFTTIIFAFLFPRILIFVLQLYFLPFEIKINWKHPLKIFKEKKSWIYLISSLLTPLCSNIDRLVLIFLNSSVSNWQLIYNGLSEISRKTGGIIKPITRIYYRLNHLTDNEKVKLEKLNKKISLLNVLLTIFFSILFLKNLQFQDDKDIFNINILFPFICSLVFIATSFMQVHSSIFFLKSMILGKIKIITTYQTIQLLIFPIIYFLCLNYSTILLIPIIYLVMKFFDFYFLKNITLE